MAVFDDLVALFLPGFRDTDNGLNINGLPTSLTSSAGFCSAGIDGCFAVDSASSPLFDVPSEPPSSFSSTSLLKPGVAPVFKLIPGLGAGFPLLLLDATGFPTFFGGGRNELKLLNAPPLPVTFARLGGGSLSPSAGLLLSRLDEPCGRLTRILPGFARSTTFWKGFLPPAAGAVTDCEGGTGLATGSESDSESE